MHADYVLHMDPWQSRVFHKVITGRSCVNRKAAMRRCKQLTLVESEMGRRYEIIYTPVPIE